MQRFTGGQTESGNIFREKRFLFLNRKVGILANMKHCKYENQRLRGHHILRILYGTFFSCNEIFLVSFGRRDYCQHFFWTVIMCKALFNIQMESM